ncbi:MAG: hypothetical protein U0Z53_18645 [Blastocatellia bacterium]
MAANDQIHEVFTIKSLTRPRGAFGVLRPGAAFSVSDCAIRRTGNRKLRQVAALQMLRDFRMGSSIKQHPVRQAASGARPDPSENTYAQINSSS